MGHTIPPKRQIIYRKLNEVKRFAKCLREPHCSRLLLLVDSAYQNISSIVYVNSVHDEEMILYSILVRLLDKSSWSSNPKVLRCLAILISE